MRNIITLLLFVFSLSINAITRDELPFSKYKVNELYHTWDTTRVNCYNTWEIPLLYTINLCDYCMPTDHKLITSHYGYRANVKRYHKGVDIKLYIGDTVKSVWKGVVRVVKYDANGYGKYIVIRHENGLETIYGHLSKHLVRTNDTVYAGKPIGLGGNTGRSTGSHLHFETRVVGCAINPEHIFCFETGKIRTQQFLFKNEKLLKA